MSGATRLISPLLARMGARRTLLSGRSLFSVSLQQRRFFSNERRHSSLATAAAAAVEEEVEDEPERVVHVEHTSACATRPRLEQLRAKLKEEPPESAPKLRTTNRLVPNGDTPQGTKELEALRISLAALPEPEAVLTDTHNRHHNYLRLSLTERCNLRCTYCMPEHGVPLQPNENILSTPELLQLATHFRNQGVTKFRLTGGEPTLRSDLLRIVEGLEALKPASIGMTTNGIALGGSESSKLALLAGAGLTGVNISLDTVDPDKFAKLTRRPAAYLDRVWRSLDRAVDIATLNPSTFSVKLNCVVMRGTNDAEVADFIRLANRYPGLQVRFIEYMPFSDNGWNWDRCVPYRELLSQLSNYEDDDVKLQPVQSADPHDTTKWYKTVSGTAVGFITSMSHQFCGACNRLRLTADGQIKVCLFDGSHDSTAAISLRDALRHGFSESELNKLIHGAVQKKHAALGGHADPADIMRDAGNNRPMTLIGG